MKISYLPKISFGFGFVGVLILNFVLNNHPQYYLLMQGCFFFYNIIQLTFATLMYKSYKSSKDIEKMKSFKFEMLIFGMYLVFTVVSVILYLWG